ncbi:hypothetical protein OB905_11740 [Halobacteria archaeon AArc-dxtr1]|nr:hypothetical protein [Halobacteria archaeon AArc-dxtr1]
MGFEYSDFSSDERSLSEDPELTDGEGGEEMDTEGVFFPFGFDREVTTLSDEPDASGSGGEPVNMVGGILYPDYDFAQERTLAESDAESRDGEGGEEMETEGVFFPFGFDREVTTLSDEPDASGSGGEHIDLVGGFFYPDYDFAQSRPLGEPGARAEMGEGTAIELMVDGIADAYDHLDEDDAEEIESEIRFSEELGAPIYADFDWQDAYGVDADEWPVTVEQTIAIYSDDPSIWEGFEVYGMGEDCSIEIDTGDITVDSSTGLIFISVDVTYNCPTNAEEIVNAVPDPEHPENEEEEEEEEDDEDEDDEDEDDEDEDGEGEGEGSSTSSTRSTRRRTNPESRFASLTSFGCLPPGESTNGQFTIRYSPEPFQSFEARISYDPDEVSVDAVHTDDSIFDERNENARYEYEHRATLDSVDHNDVGGVIEIEASHPSGSFSMSRRTRFHRRIMFSLDVTAIADSGTLSTFELENVRLYDEDGGYIERLSDSSHGLRIDNGIDVWPATLAPGYSLETRVMGNIGEEIEEFRQVFRLNPEIVDNIAVTGPSNPTVTWVETEDDVDDDEDEPDPLEYAIVEGSFSEPMRMDELFRWVWETYSEEQLVEFVDPFNESEVPPSRTEVTRIDADDVALLNTEVGTETEIPETSDEPIYDREVRHVPLEELPEPYVRDVDGNDVSLTCSSDGTISTSTIEDFTQNGIMYWPLVFDVVVELNNIYPDAVGRNDVVAESWSETNPAIEHAIGELIRDSSENTLYVPLTLVIPQNEPEQEYPVHFDFEMWIGGERVLPSAAGLYIGGIQLGEHVNQMVGSGGLTQGRPF